ncbi:hypothetical protein G7054_g969 [Neopestalotiopsis clavispora]|nr:hypothetical protein G7054_g969 [Neopestalotiopsis clavispora]
MHRWLGSFGALFLLVAALVIQRQRRRTSAIYRNGYQSPVHHRPWDPFLGIDLTIATHNDLPSLRRLHQKYGHTFATETLVNDTTIYTIAPQNIKAVNMRHDHWGIEPQRLPGMEFFCGRGILTMDGEVWKQARSLLKPSFAKGNISDLTVLSRETDKLLEQLPTNGQTVDLQPLLYIIFLNTSLHFLLGISPDQGENAAPCTSTEFVDDFHDALFLTMIRMILGRLWKLFPKSKYLRVCRTAHSYLDYYVHLALDGDQAPMEHAQSAGQRSLVQGLSTQTDRSLRLYPIFPLMGRVALCDTFLPVGGGPLQDAPIFAPRGTKVEVGNHALHRDPRVFAADVEDFRPDRWNTISPAQFEFMGFGGGNRACLGRQKSLAEAAYILARMARQFERIESRDDQKWKADMKLTCRNANGCKIAVYRPGFS